jgi:hypothetical protein
VGAGVFGGCSPSEDSVQAECPGTCPVPKTQVPATDVSFARDLFADGDGAAVKPGIIRRACNFGACHGVDGPRSEAGLYLGPPPGKAPTCGPGTAACTLDRDCSCEPSGSCFEAGDCATSDGAASYCVCDNVQCAPGERCVPGDSPEANTALKQRIIDGLVNVRSKTLPSMPLIDPENPENSFLMLKVDGCQNCIGVKECASPGGTDCCTPQDSKTEACGDRMPQGSQALVQAERDIIRKWIVQGALND